MSADHTWMFMQFHLTFFKKCLPSAFRLIICKHNIVAWHFILLEQCHKIYFSCPRLCESGRTGDVSIFSWCSVHRSAGIQWNHKMSKWLNMVWHCVLISLGCMECFPSSQWRQCFSGRLIEHFENLPFSPVPHASTHLLAWVFKHHVATQGAHSFSHPFSKNDHKTLLRFLEMSMSALKVLLRFLVLWFRLFEPWWVLSNSWFFCRKGEGGK